MAQYFEKFDSSSFQNPAPMRCNSLLDQYSCSVVNENSPEIFKLPELIVENELNYNDIDQSS